MGEHDHWSGDKSRMRRESHVRFREGLGVKFPRATRLVMGFRDQRDARRVLDVLPKRFGRYGLTVHPTKTKLVPFCPPPSRAEERNEPEAPRPGTFDLLGFTHYWGRSLRDYWVIKQKTAASRFSRAVRSIDL
jgi:RNA-directed DNA polymerase